MEDKETLLPKLIPILLLLTKNHLGLRMFKHIMPTKMRQRLKRLVMVLEQPMQNLILQAFGTMQVKNRGVMNYCLAKTPMDLASTGGAGKKINGKHL